MANTRPSVADLNSRTQADVVSRVDGATPQVRRSIIGALVTAFTGGLNALYGYIDAIAIECNPYTAVRTLPQWASIWLGPNPQKQPSYASGALLLTDCTAEADIPDGTAMQSPLGAEYLTVGNVTVAGDGTATLQLLAIDTGSDGNQPAGTVISFVSPLLGVTASGIVGAGGLGGGADLETTDALRARMIQRIQNPPHGGNAADYVAWALSVSPITRAWCFPTYSGAGTVRVYVANDNFTTGPNIAADADVAAANTYLQSVKPLGVVITVGGAVQTGLTVLAPVKQPVNFTLTDSPDNAATRAAIIAGLTELFATEAAPEGTIPIHHIIGTVYNAAGIYDFSMTAPTVDQTAAAGAILTLGSVTFG